MANANQVDQGLHRPVHLPILMIDTGFCCQSTTGL